MRSKENVRHPKWPTAAILSKFPKKLKLPIDLIWPEMRISDIQVAYRSEMARNAIESEFRTSIESEFWTSKMAAGSHFVKRITKIKIMVLI